MRREIEDLKMETLKMKSKTSEMKISLDVISRKNSGRPQNLRFSNRMYKKWYTKRKSKLKMNQTDLSGQ